MHMSRARFRWAAVLAGIAMIAPAVPARADGPAGAYLLTVVPRSGPATTRHFTRTYANRCLAVRATGGILFGE
ncbi:hypothetical protein GCM10010402_35600 [Actinomadura luteofluorescens]|nr:hypothetical protein [Actinomadura glauciflava]